MPTQCERSVKSGHEAIDWPRTLDRAAALARIDPDAAVAAVPGLAHQLAADAASGRFAEWGRSSAIDENVGEAVIPEGLFATLHRRAACAAQWPVGNAGLLHVYGYLLSDVETPYGLKRTRWLDGALARAYGLPVDEFRPTECGSTLLARVTQAARALLQTRTVRVDDVDGVATRTAMGRVPSEGPYALVYAVDRGDGEKVVTTFPVADPAALLTGLEAEEPRLRWNAS